ncbi:MAG: hypothetical protein JO090_13045 [Rhizobacter sp.]|nr:hypothetical protein [Rhizobacter sp.]
MEKLTASETNMVLGGETDVFRKQREDAADARMTDERDARLLNDARQPVAPGGGSDTFRLISRISKLGRRAAPFSCWNPNGKVRRPSCGPQGMA